MPSSAVKSFAGKSGKSVEEVERLWDKAKGIVSKGYDAKEGSSEYYGLVTGILKKMCRIKESLAERFLAFLEGRE